MRKICYLTGTRADFGLMTKILKAIDNDSSWQLILLVTGMHLMKEFGQTIKEVKKLFSITEVIEATYKEDNRLSMARFVATCLKKTVEVLKEAKPDVVLILGDRGEALAMAAAAAYLTIPIVHIHGGDLTRTVDDKARHAISMLADWHLAGPKESRKRLISIRIKPEKVVTVGAPGLDEIRTLPKRLKKDLIVVLLHPEEKENQAAKQMKIVLRAVISFGLPVKVIYPNADAGGRAMIKVIFQFINQYPQLIESFKNLKREDYLKLLQQAKVMVSNSSSGLVESPSLRLPVVNVGSRQKGRLQAKNIISVDYQEKQIKKAVTKALFDKIFINSLKNIKNPYGDGKTAARVLSFLNKTFV